MIPNNSRKTNGCDPVSSNCVVWQGPDLTCVDICHGDTISDVVAKLCEELAQSLKSTGLSDFDITRINQKCLPGTASNLEELQQHIIDELCVSSQQAKMAGSALTCETIKTCEFSLPQCLEFYDNNLQRQVVSLPFQQYLEMLGNHICNIQNQIQSHQTMIDNHEGRITTLEQQQAAPQQQLRIVPQYTGSPGVSTQIDAALANLESAFGELQQGTGNQSELLNAVSYQQTNLNNKDQLNGTGKMSSLTGWVNNPQNMAQSFRNAWLTMSDMRDSVTSVLTQITKSSCEDITYGFYANVNKSGSTLTSFNVNFTQCIIPTAFKDCNKDGCKVTVTDASGNSTSVNADIYSLQTATAGLTVPIANLDTASATYVVTTDFCFSNEAGSQCQNIVTHTIQNQDVCPDVTFTPGTTTVAWVVDASVLPSTYSAEIVFYNSTGSVVASQTKDNPGSSWGGTFSGLESGVQYYAVISYGPTVSGGGYTVASTCPNQYVTTTALTCTSAAKDADTDFSTNSTNLYTDKTAGYVTFACNDTSAPACAGTSNPLVWVAGFNKTTNNPEAFKLNDWWSSDSISPCIGDGKVGDIGTIIDYNNPRKSFVGDGTLGTVAVTGDNAAPMLGDGWKYADAITNDNNITWYIWYEWDETPAVNCKQVPKILFSCISKTYISQDGMTKFIPRSAAAEGDVERRTSYSDAVNFHIATGNTTVNGWSYTIGSAAYGTITYTPNSLYQRLQRFNYQSATTFTIADTFTANLDTGDTYTSGNYTASILRGYFIDNPYTDIVVYTDCNSADGLTDAQNESIVDTFMQLQTDIQTTCAGWAGKLYVIPLTDKANQLYLKHHQITATRGRVMGTSTGNGLRSGFDFVTNGVKNGTEIAGWWKNGTISTTPTNVIMFSFGKTVYNSGSAVEYSASATLSADYALASQPIAEYENDFCILKNILVDQNRDTANLITGWIDTQVSAGHISNEGTAEETTNAIYRCDGHYIVPIMSGNHSVTDGTDTAYLIQALAALKADEYTAGEYNAFRFGSDYLNIDSITGGGVPAAANALKTLTNPYGGHSCTVPTGGGTVLIDGLYRYNFQVIPFIDASVFTGVSATDKTGAFRDVLKGAFCLDSASCPAGWSDKVMAHNDGSKEGVTYQDALAATNTLAGACDQAALGSCFTIYNTTGNNFDATVRAYSTAAGARNGDFRDELVNGRWYSECPGTNGSSYVAQYSRTYPYWNTKTKCS